MVTELLQTALGSNSLFTGGILLGLVGVIAMWLKDIPAKILAWAKHFFVVTLNFNSMDELMFNTLVEYMNSQDALRDSPNFTVRTVRQGSEYQDLSEEINQGGKPQAYLSPGEGFHIFRMDGKWLWMKREIQTGTAIIEKITLSMFGRDRRPLEEFISKAIERRVARELDLVAIYIPSPYNSDWQRTKLGNHRKMDSIVLKEGQSDSIINDMREFFASKNRYENLGIPWRRGYMLYGPPGTGKTSLVTALASELCLNLCTLSLASANVTDEKIGNLFSTVPPRSIILIEDIDSFFHAREKSDSGVKLSYSGFINALDGVASHEGSVIFMTTNHPELIDEAAIRSGRVDFKLELNKCDTHQIYHMFLKFFDDKDKADEFAKLVPPYIYSPANIQEKLLKAKSTNEALEAFRG